MGNAIGTLDRRSVERRVAIGLIKHPGRDEDKELTLLNGTLSSTMRDVKGRFTRPRAGGRPSAAQRKREREEIGESHQKTPKKQRTSPRGPPVSVSPPPGATPYQATASSVSDVFPLPTKSITAPSLRRCVIEDIEKLQKGEEVVVVIDSSNKYFSKIRQWTASYLISHQVNRFGRTKYEFHGSMQSFPKRDLVTYGRANNADLNRWLSAGDGFVVNLLQYNRNLPVRMKDVYDGLVEVWQVVPQNFASHNWYELCGRTKSPCAYRPILERFLKEVEGDNVQTMEIVIAAHRKRYETLQKKSYLLAKQVAHLTEALSNQNLVNLIPPHVHSEFTSHVGIDAIETIDAVYRDAIFGHFKSYHNMNAALLSNEQCRTVHTVFCQSFPMTYAFFSSCALTQRNTTNKERESDKVVLKTNKSLQAAFSVIRIRNPKLLTHWAACDALGHISQATPKTAHLTNVWRRYSLTYQSAVTLLNTLSNNAENSMRELVKQEERKSAIIDNFQHVQNLKNNRGGRGTKVIDGTVRICRRHHKVPPPIGSLIHHKFHPEFQYLVVHIISKDTYSFEVIARHKTAYFRISWPNRMLKYFFIPNAEPKPILTYVRQYIPRAWYMFKPNASYALSPLFHGAPPKVDENGHQQAFLYSSEYLDLIRASHTIQTLKTNLMHLPMHPPGDIPSFTLSSGRLASDKSKPHTHDPIEYHDFRRITGNRKFVAEKLEAMEPNLTMASSYQKQYVKSYIHSVESVSQVLFLRMSEHDEVTNRGSMKMFVQLLHDFGLTEKVGVDSYRASDNIEDQTFILWGDCATMEQIKNIQYKIFKEITTPGNEEYVSNLLRSIARIREGQGDLHLAMHMLQVIYKYWYPGLIQPIQFMLKYKRIQLDPLPRFQSSKDLLELVAGELEKYRQIHWIEQVDIDGQRGEATKFVVESNIIEQYAEGSEKRHWLNNHIPPGKTHAELTLSEVTAILTYSDQVMVVYGTYKLYCENLERSSDKKLRFLSQFLRFSQDFFMFLNCQREGDSVAAEKLINLWLPRWQHAGKNRYVQLVLRKCETLYDQMTPEELEEMRLNRFARISEGRGMVAMDDLCEMLNDWLKKMTGSKELDDLVDKSIFVSLLRRCARSVGSFGLNRYENKSSWIPQRVRERRTIYKLFSVAKVWTETPGGDISDDFLWQWYDKVKLKTENTKNVKLDKFNEKVESVFLDASKKEFVGLTEEVLMELGDELEQHLPTMAEEIVRDLDPIDDPNCILVDDEPNLDHDGIEDTNPEEGYGQSQQDVTDCAMTDEDMDDVINELSKLKRYKLNKQALEDIDLVGTEKLGNNLAEEREKMRAKEERRKAQIHEAVRHYSERAQKRNEAMDQMIKEIEGGVNEGELEEWEIQWKRALAEENIV